MTRCLSMAISLEDSNDRTLIHLTWCMPPSAGADSAWLKLLWLFRDVDVLAPQSLHASSILLHHWMLEVSQQYEDQGRRFDIPSSLTHPACSPVKLPGPLTILSTPHNNPCCLSDLAVLVPFLIGLSTSCEELFCSRMPPSDVMDWRQKSEAARLSRTWLFRCFLTNMAAGLAEP